MKPIIALTDFETRMPEFLIPQSETLEITAQSHRDAALVAGVDGDRIANLLNRYGVKPTQISHRAVENPEIIKRDANILERTEFFGLRARQVFSSFYPTQATAPDHIIHVTCTGYISPSPAQHIVNNNRWSEKTNVTHAYHMGCYAALPAIRMAEGFVAAREKNVDIVHTEMCALHMDRHDHSPEQLVVQSLFADGHIKYSAKAADSVSSGFKVLSTNELIVPNSQADMSWVTADWGMKMTLSREVPKKIGASLRPFIQKLVQDSGHSLSEILKEATFAIHPGGPKIIDSVQGVLELTEPQIRASREVLFERGNMSSATLPHVWMKLLEQKIPSGQVVVSLAFGPGLTIFGALFESI